MTYVNVNKVDILQIQYLLVFVRPFNEKLKIWDKLQNKLGTSGKNRNGYLTVSLLLNNLYLPRT